MKKHTTKEGDEVYIKNMSDNLLINTMRMLKRKSKTGVKVMRGGFILGSDEPCLDVDYYYGEQPLNELIYSDYMEEYKNRDLDE